MVLLVAPKEGLAPGGFQRACKEGLKGGAWIPGCGSEAFWLEGQAVEEKGENM